LRHQLLEYLDGDVVTELSKVLKTQEEHLLKTVDRFLKELEDNKSKLKEVI